MLKKNLLILSVIALTGCASILTDKTQPLSVNSNVTGAQVTLDGKVLGVTPFVGTITKGNKDATLTVSKDGYESKTIIMIRDIEPTFWVNILSGGVFGSSTDYGNDKMWKYSPTNVNIDLVKK